MVDAMIFTVLLLAVCIYVFVEHGIRRGNRFVLWLTLLFTGAGVLFSGELPVGPVENFVVNMWVLTVIALPLYWAVAAIVRVRKG